LVFEHLGYSVYQVLQQNSYSGFSAEIIQNLSIQVLYAMIFLKSEGIIHSDLKPENIVFNLDANSDIVKLVDFSSACFEGGKLYYLLLFTL